MKGTVPISLEGFYKGKLQTIINSNLKATLAKFIFSFWLPWYGKWFDTNQNRGDNIVSTYLIPLLKFRLKENFRVKKEFGGVHVFSFKTSVQKSLKDNIKVLQLNYDLPQNPPNIRQVIDEIAEVDKNVYLGKAHIKEGRLFRTIAFFTLWK